MGEGVRHEQAPEFPHVFLQVGGDLVESPSFEILIEPGSIGRVRVV